MGISLSLPRHPEGMNAASSLGFPLIALTFVNRRRAADVWAGLRQSRDCALAVLYEKYWDVESQLWLDLKDVGWRTMPSIVGGDYCRDRNELREHRELRRASAGFRDHDRGHCG
jgi:hypothetical protein